MPIPTLAGMPQILCNFAEVALQMLPQPDDENVASNSAKVHLLAVWVAGFCGVGCT